MLDFSLLVDSKSLYYFLSTEETRKMFVILLFAAKTVIFHSLSPDQKTCIVKLMKNNFSFNPSVVTVGNLNSSYGMLLEADIGITIGTPNGLYNRCSDIVIKDFSQLKTLILVHGHYSLFRFIKIFVLVIFKVSFVGIIEFLFQIQTGFSGTPLIPYELTMVFELLISFLPFLMIGIYSKDISEKLILENPILYYQNFYSFIQKKRMIVTFLLRAFIEGVFIYIFLTFGIGFIANSHGYTEDLETKGIIAFLLVNCCLYSKMITYNTFQIRIYLSVLLSMLLLASILSIFCNDDSLYQLASQSIILDQSAS